MLLFLVAVDVEVRGVNYDRLLNYITIVAVVARFFLTSFIYLQLRLALTMIHNNNVFVEFILHMKRLL